MNIWLHNILCDFFFIHLKPLQCNSYLSHVRSFFKISSNFRSLTSSYPLLKMFFSTLSFLWTSAVGPRQNNNLTFVIQMLINVFPRIVFVRTFFVVKVTIYIFCIFFLFNYICIHLFIKIINFINDDCKLNFYVSLIMTLIHVCLDPCQWWFFPPISLLNISVYRLQPRLFMDSPPYLKKNQKDHKELRFRN
jgi:hypothetical protein